jgi:hypothetical protein
VTAFLSRLLGCLPLLWFVFALNVFPSSTWGYDAPTQAKVTYDGESVAAFGYDSASVPSANERENGIVGVGSVFADFAAFLAAEGITPTSEGLINISQHLSTVESEGPEFAMYSRLTTAFENGETLTS